MNTYSLTHFDLFDPALQLEAEDVLAEALAWPGTERIGKTDIHLKVVGVIALIEQLNRQLNEPALKLEPEKQTPR